MRNSNDILTSIKKAALSTAERSKPVGIFFGTVTKEKPLEINVEQKLTLKEDFLVLTRNVTEHKIEMTVDHVTENRSGGSGDSSYASHNHEYKGRKEFIVHNGLVVDDEVIMIREQGGQKFVVLDRIGRL